MRGKPGATKTALRPEASFEFGLSLDELKARVSGDPYLYGHCEQVSRYARRTGEILALESDEMRVTCYAALLHDIGKTCVSEAVLYKPGPLLPDERRQMQAHARIGYEILIDIPAMREVATAVLYHHEWFNGAGYPEGLAGEEIPLASRIVGTVDAYCAMLDKRSYKDAMSPTDAIAELERCSGTQFDPHVVECVVQAIRKG